MVCKEFDPRGKTFHFCLDQYTCYRRDSGVCSLEYISLDELKDSASCVGVIGESSIEYCRGMAKLFLDDEFPAPARIFFNTQCGHYSFSDGQHRTCVVARVLQKGGEVALNAEIGEQDSVCRDCLIKVGFRKRESSMSTIDKLFRTKRYRDLKQSKKNYKKKEFIYTFDN